jgi:stalled ribosome rescue protein Dom34
VALAEISGFAATSSGVGEIVKNPLFKKLLEGVTSQETKSLLEILESKLASSDTRSVLYSIEDIEKAIIYSDGNSPIPEFLLLTNKYLATNRQKNRIQRLLQIAANKRYKTRVVDSDSPAGKRLTQLGGIVCLSRAT